MFNSGILVLFDVIRALVFFLLYAYQSGFIRSHSTVYQLLEMYHRVCQNLDERLSTILIFCDNNNGSSTDPWGTPALTRSESDSSLFTNTNCLLPLK
jgi:hypothetical protein